MSNCKYNPLGSVPLDRSYVTAVSTKIMTACSLKANDVETNTLAVDDLVVDTITANTGNITTVNATDVNTTNITASGDGTFLNVTATNDLSVGNNATITNDLTVGGDGTFVNVTASDTVTSTDYTVTPVGFPSYDLLEVSGATRNVLSYGLDNTGATDNSALFAAIPGVGELYFPCGTYRFDSPIALGDNRSITGEHWGCVFFNFTDNTPATTFITMNANDTQINNLFLKYTGTATDAVAVNCPNLGVQHRINISHIQLDTNGAATDLFANFLVASPGSLDYMTLSECYIQTTDTSVIVDGSSIAITNNAFINRVADVIAIQVNGGSRASISNNYFNSTTTLLMEINSANTIISGNTYNGAFTTTYGGTAAALATILDTLEVQADEVNTTQLTSRDTNDQILIEDSANANKQYAVEVESETFKISETGVGTSMYIYPNSVFQLGNSSTGNANLDTNGIYRFGSKSIANRNISINTTGVKTVTITLDILATVPSSYTSGSLEITANGCQGNSALFGYSKDVSIVRKVAGNLGTWAVENIVNDTSALNIPVIALDAATNLINQIIFTITTPNVINPSYYLNVNIEMCGFFVIDAINTVVA